MANKKNRRKIDSRMLLIFLAVILLALAFGFLVTHIIRVLFPHISAETLWDEISIIPAIGFITFVATKTLFVTKTFHLYVANIIPTGKIFVEMKRRSFGPVSWIFIPESVLEYKTKSSQKDLFIRNIAWYGIRGIDRCEFLIHYAPDSAKKNKQDRDCYYNFHVPYMLIKNYYSLYADLCVLSENKKNIITRENVFRNIYDDELVMK